MENNLTTILTSSGEITLSPEIIKQQLVKGDKTKLTDAEINYFLHLCVHQKLNPFIGEAYLIKFGNDAQVIMSCEAYKRRASENPNHLGIKSGVVILSEGKPLKKEGSASYGNPILAGWAEVKTKAADGSIIPTLKEVDFKEYNKNNSIWKEKPGTMIEKVAISQALRQAYPSDFNGTYTSEEFSEKPVVEEEAEKVDKITQEQRQMLFAKAKEVYGSESQEKIMSLLNERGFERTTNLPVDVFIELMTAIENDSIIEAEVVE